MRLSHERGAIVTTALPYVKADAFEAHTRREEAALSIELTGIADLRVQWQLKAF